MHFHLSMKGISEYDWIKQLTTLFVLYSVHKILFYIWFHCYSCMWKSTSKLQKSSFWEMFKRLCFRRNMNEALCDWYRCLLTHYIKLNNCHNLWWQVLLHPPLRLLYFYVSASYSPSSPSVKLFPPSFFGAVWDEYKTGESVSCGEPQTKITGTFFIKTHVHPPTHNVTHACTVTHTLSHRQRSLLFEDPWREV